MASIESWFENFISYKLEGFGWSKEKTGSSLKFTSNSGAVRSCIAVKKLSENHFEFDKVCTYIDKENFDLIINNWDALKQKNVSFYFVKDDFSYYFTFNPKSHEFLSKNKSLNKTFKLLEEHAKLK